MTTIVAVQLPRCGQCGTRIEPSRGSRTRKWCSPACRKAASRRRRSELAPWGSAEPADVSFAPYDDTDDTDDVGAVPDDPLTRRRRIIEEYIAATARPSAPRTNSPR
jgi:hypothetical protein